MSRDCCVAFPRGVMGLSHFVIVVFADHIRILFSMNFHVFKKTNFTTVNQHIIMALMTFEG